MDDCNNTFKSLHTDNLDTVTFTRLKINSIQNKFKLLSEEIKGSVYVLMFPDTKIDDSFPLIQF